MTEAAGGPAFSHKARVLADWTLVLFFRRETAQLAALEHPADDFRDAAHLARIPTGRMIPMSPEITELPR